MAPGMHPPAAGTTLGSKKGLEALLRELSVMKRIDHPHCVKLYELLDDPGTHKKMLRG